MTTVTLTVDDDLVEYIAEALHNIEYPTYRPTAHPDSNRWSWRGNGFLGADGATSHYDEYRDTARAVVAALTERGQVTG